MSHMIHCSHLSAKVGPLFASVQQTGTRMASLAASANIIGSASPRVPTSHPMVLELFDPVANIGEHIT